MNNIDQEKEEIVFSKDWVFLVGRPYTLFGASLYQAWFDSPQIFKLFGISVPDNLYLEEHENVVRRYVINKQLGDFASEIKNIVLNNRSKAKEILDRGLSLSEDAKQYLENSSFKTLKDAVDFLVELALYASVFSYFSYPIAKDVNDIELVNLAEKLRAISYYPQIVAKIINPLAEHQAGKNYNLLTIEEILGHKNSNIDIREKEHFDGKRFIYAKIDGKEIIYYVDDITKLIEKLERVKIGGNIKGQIAYPGKVIGKVRLVLTNDVNIDFDDGDILVAVTTNPTLVPLIKKSAAMVTDEGGITCHAAIISRELKKPCIIGTKFVTHTFKDGDMVEVDANTGIVKIL